MAAFRWPTYTVAALIEAGCPNVIPVQSFLHFRVGTAVGILFLLRIAYC